MHRLVLMWFLLILLLWQVRFGMEKKVQTTQVEEEEEEEKDNREFNCLQSIVPILRSYELHLWHHSPCENWWHHSRVKNMPLKHYLLPSPNAYPHRIAITGGLGLARNSSATIAHVITNDPSIILLVGDPTYANQYLTTGGKGAPCCFWAFPDAPTWETYLNQVDRTETPWLVAAWHPPCCIPHTIRNLNARGRKWKALLCQHHVDVVFLVMQVTIFNSHKWISNCKLRC